MRRDLWLIALGMLVVFAHWNLRDRDWWGVLVAVAGALLVVGIVYGRPGKWKKVPQ